MSSSTSASPSLALSLSKKTKQSPRKQSPQKQSPQKQQQQRRQVLTEEDYTSTLETIVQRDYFPDIPDLEAQVALWEKRSRGDVAGAVAIRRAARQLQQQEESLQEIERHQEQDSEHSDVRCRVVPRPLHRETVAGFHTRVTSQDNHHFEQTQKVELQQQRHTLEQVFDNQNNHKNKNRLLLTKDGQPQPQSSASPFLLASDRFNPTPNQLELTSQLAQQPGGRNPRNNSLFFSPPPHEECSLDQQPHSSKQNEFCDEKLSHSSSVTKKRTPPTSSTTSSLMMPPPPPVSVTTASNKRMLLSSSNKNHTTTTTNISATTNNGEPSSSLTLLSTTSSSTATTTTMTTKLPLHHDLNLVEYVPKASMVKRIEPSQTRFPPLSSMTRRPPNHFQHPENDDSSSSVTTTDYSTTTDLDESPQRSIQAERQARLKRLKREQETLIQMTPLIEPGINRQKIVNHHGRHTHNHDGDDDDSSSAGGSPIITWGTVASTPMVLGDNCVHTNKKDDSTARSSSSFRLPQENAREEAVRQTMIKKEQEKKERIRQQKKQQKYSTLKNTTKNKNTPLDRSIANLTPAARSLLARTTTAKTSIMASSSATDKSGISSSSKLISARSKDAFASALRSSYSSTPQQQQQRLRRHPKGSSSKTPSTNSAQRKRNLVSKATPLQLRKSTKPKSTNIHNTLIPATTTRSRSERHHASNDAKTTSGQRNITDGLLHLPK